MERRGKGKRFGVPFRQKSFIKTILSISKHLHKLFWFDSQFYKWTELTVWSQSPMRPRGKPSTERRASLPRSRSADISVARPFSDGSVGWYSLWGRCFCHIGRLRNLKQLSCPKNASLSVQRIHSSGQVNSLLTSRSFPQLSAAGEPFSYQRGNDVCEMLYILYTSFLQIYVFFRSFVTPVPPQFLVFGVVTILRV